MLHKYFNKRVMHPLFAFLKKGITSRKLSLTLALGICFGIVPIFGISTTLLIVIALLLKLNVVAMQIVNYAMAIVKIALFVPFLKLGQIIFKGPYLHYNFSDLMVLAREDLWASLSTIWQVSSLGILVWLIIAIPLAFVIYYFSFPIFCKKERQIKLTHSPIIS